MILEGNVILGVLVKDFPDLEPEFCRSMYYMWEDRCINYYEKEGDID